MRQLMTCAAAVLVMALLAPSSPAQVRGMPAPDGQQGTSKSAVVPGRPLGHQGVMPTPIGVSPAPAPGFPTPTPIGVPPMLPTPGSQDVGSSNGFHHRHHNNFFVGAYPVYVPVPVVVDPSSMYEVAPDQADEGADDQAVVPGPTIFERRTPADMTDVGVGNPEPAPLAASAPANTIAAQAGSAAGSQPAQPQDPSVLVFRDGHQLQVQNYAIVGDFLYDFTPGHARKVPLSQLDLPATVKANDERGLDFTLPGSKGGS